jgi:quinohemoprotein ethanol dehydrogenase
MPERNSVRSVGRVGLLALLVLSLSWSCTSQQTNSAGSEISGTGDNWSAHGGGIDESGFSRLDAINAQTIGKLGLAWSLDLDDERTLQATPLAVDGALYFTGSYGNIYAVDGASGKVLWKYDPATPDHNPDKLRYVLPVNRGAAYADGRVFIGTLDGRLIAVDAKTGKLAWSAETVARDSKHTITGAPRTFGDKVIIGNGGGDFGARGYVTAYDQKTGKQVWRFYTVPGSPEENKGDPAMERAAATWSGEYWKTGTGGTVWNGITFDPEMNRVYIGTGNSGPFDPSVRSPGNGDNLYLTSIVALDAGTGQYIWHYQMNPREAWDYKSTANMISATIPIDGKPRKVLMQAPTNGFFYVLDRSDGKLISAGKIGKVTWADSIDINTGRPVEAKNIRYETGEATLWPGPNGAHNWQDMSYNPKSGLVYIPYMQLGMKFIKKPDVLGGLAMEPVMQDPEDGKGALVAYDPVAQKVKWKVQHPFMWNGGTLSTSGNLVFQGTADGFFSAYDAESGKRLWRFNAGLGIIAPPISFAAGGRQYVSVLVGYGGTNILGGTSMNIGWKYGAQKRRLLTFALDGKAVLAPSAPRSTEIQPIDDPAIRISQADAALGQPLFTGNCAACHGLDAVSGGAPAPDLRESPIALQSDTLWQVVHDGALLKRGMPPFKDLTRQQSDQIHAFIRARARAALGTGRQLPAAAGASRF